MEQGPTGPPPKPSAQLGSKVTAKLGAKLTAPRPATPTGAPGSTTVRGEVAESTWGRLELGIFAGALLVLLLGLPLGLEEVGAAGALRATLLIDGSGPLPPLELLFLRIAAALPLGDLAVRTNVACAVTGALAAALTGRLVRDACVGLRPPAHARQIAAERWHEPVAAASAAAILVFGRTFFESTTAGGAPPLALLLTLVGWRAVVRVASRSDDAAAGLRLALAAGLALGAGRGAVLFLWAPLLLLALHALRRGERWPLVAPLACVAAAGLLLIPVATAARTGATAEEVTRALRALVVPPAAEGAPGLAEIVSGASEQLGVVATLLAGVGALVLAARAPFTGALWIGSIGLGALLAAAAPTGVARGGAFALLLVVALACVAAGVGAAYLASKLGPARLPAALVLGVVAVLPPALDGGAARWRRQGRLPARLLEAAHDRAPSGGRIDPGTPEMEALLRYGAALGLRPDLHIDAPGASRPSRSAAPLTPRRP
jgi:hypothetical protein